MRDDLVVRAAVMQSITKEYNRHRTGDGLRLAWIETAVNRVPSGQCWIPCSERLPETEDKVLCQTVTKKGIINFVIGYYIADSSCWVCGMNSNVIAWMPLPEPYKEDNDG